MLLKRFFLVLILIITFAPIVEAGKENADLDLYKLPLLEFEDARQLGLCPGLRNWREGRDSPDLRTDLRNFHCQGRFNLAMSGPKDKTITLFAGFNYDRQFGYLIVRKLDNKKIWIPDLMVFPANEWISMLSEQGHNEEYGSYEVYFSPSPNFDQRISSLKWGQWWKGGAPN